MLTAFPSEPLLSPNRRPSKAGQGDARGRVAFPVGSVCGGLLQGSVASKGSQF